MSTDCRLQSNDFSPPPPLSLSLSLSLSRFVSFLGRLGGGGGGGLALFSMKKDFSPPDP